MPLGEMALSFLGLIIESVEAENVDKQAETRKAVSMKSKMEMKEKSFN